MCLFVDSSVLFVKQHTYSFVFDFYHRQDCKRISWFLWAVSCWHGMHRSNVSSKTH